MNIDLDNNCQSIKAKFSKQVNMAVLGLKFNQIKGTKRPNKIERIEWVKLSFTSWLLK